MPLESKALKLHFLQSKYIVTSNYFFLPVLAPSTTIEGSAVFFFLSPFSVLFYSHRGTRKRFPSFFSFAIILFLFPSSSLLLSLIFYVPLEFCRISLPLTSRFVSGKVFSLGKKNHLENCLTVFPFPILFVCHFFFLSRSLFFETIFSISLHPSIFPTYSPHEPFFPSPHDLLEMESAPRNIQVRPLSSSTMVITWEPPETPNGQVTVSFFSFFFFVTSSFRTTRKRPAQFISTVFVRKAPVRLCVCGCLCRRLTLCKWLNMYVCPGDATVEKKTYIYTRAHIHMQVLGMLLTLTEH